MDEQESQFCEIEMHKCIEIFNTEKIDRCIGDGDNTCEGTNPMILSVWYQGQDGTECFYDNWIKMECNYCPFCGLKSDK